MMVSSLSSVEPEEALINIVIRLPVSLMLSPIEML